MPRPSNVCWRAEVNVCSAVSYFSTLLGSIIGAGRLSFRVRDGTGRFPHAITTANLPPPHTAVRVETCSRTYHPPPPTPRTGTRWLWDGVVPKPYSGRETRCYSHPKRGCKTCCVCEDHRLISTGQLHTLQCFHIQPINPVVYRKSYQIHLREPSSRSVLPA